MIETTLTTTAHRSASERIAAVLRAAILAGEHPPGSWIRQADVAAKYGASRLPVREALRMLESEGLTEYHPHQGARVPLLSLHEVDVAYQMRERLEPLALSESLAGLTSADLAALKDLQRRIELDDELRNFIELDREFHLLTYSHCAIDHLMTTVNRLWNSTQPYRRLYVSSIAKSALWITHAEHRLLIEALERRDPFDGERVLGGHIRRTRTALISRPDLFTGL
ncbi:GntR family transcriptional regulator [Actinomadura viridis]|uniref:GntR family transcriptional regulator n=1 Tax=Actinomadura viridis TaxID=58110 RepID=UPI003691EDF8